MRFRRKVGSFMGVERLFLECLPGTARVVFRVSRFFDLIHDAWPAAHYLSRGLEVTSGHDQWASRPAGGAAGFLGGDKPFRIWANCSSNPGVMGDFAKTNRKVSLTLSGVCYN
jgi:hypothetical protein